MRFLKRLFICSRHGHKETLYRSRRNCMDVITACRRCDATLRVRRCSPQFFKQLMRAEKHSEALPIR